MGSTIKSKESLVEHPSKRFAMNLRRCLKNYDISQRSFSADLCLLGFAPTPDSADRKLRRLLTGATDLKLTTLDFFGSVLNVPPSVLAYGTTFEVEASLEQSNRTIDYSYLKDQWIVLLGLVQEVMGYRIYGPDTSEFMRAASDSVLIAQSSSDTHRRNCHLIIRRTAASKGFSPDKALEYIDEAEHQDGYEYWFKFDRVSDLEDDVLLYLNDGSKQKANR